ncbi:GroES-like protein [Clavulina sp. PMI_390]|nr:GroES-like protein [Clavulina sp. PMI_390]
MSEPKSATVAIDLPSVQQAWRAHDRGTPRNAIKLDTIPVPEPGVGQALIKVEAAALNPVGYKILALIPSFMRKRPHVVEFDFSGTVVDPNGTSFQVGDKVWGTCELMKGDGAISQYVVATEENAALVPAHLSTEQAAGLGIVWLTAQQALFEYAGVQPGQSVMVLGGSSSLGGTVIQMLKQIDCKVYASCSGKNVEFVRSLGADVVYDYTTSPIHQQVAENPPSPKFHAIIDCVGGYDFFAHSEAYLAPKGLYVAPGTAISGWHNALGDVWAAIYALRPTWLGGTNRTFKSLICGLGKQRFAAVVDIVNKGWDLWIFGSSTAASSLPVRGLGSLVPVIDSVFEFTDLYSAYDKLLTGRAKGKIVVRVP